jgi:histidyl-tRNA synthetase
MGIERLMMILAKRDLERACARSGIAVMALGDGARERLVPLVAALRRNSGPVPVTIDYGAAKVAAQFRKADRANARAALIVGDDELAAGNAVLRDLATRAQDTIPLEPDDDAAAVRVLRWYAALPPQPAMRSQAAS